MQMTTVAEVDLSAIRDNLRAIKARVGPGVRVIPAVKADAYGHGAAAVSRECVAAGADVLGVASLDEAVELRQAGITGDILILGCQVLQAAGEIVRWGITTTVCNPEFAKALSKEAVRQNKPAAVHLKIDTGMGRIGITPTEAVAFVCSLMALPGLRVEGVFTHFPSADEPDREFTLAQIEAFRCIIQELKTAGLGALVAHASNSSGILAYPEGNFDAVRPGIALYGLYPSDTIPRTLPLREALTLKTRVVFLKKADVGRPISYGRTHVLSRDSLVATLPIGYADGYSRKLSGVGEAAIRDTRVSVIGRVCMDQVMIDVTDVPDVQLGDEVTLYGGGYDYLSVSRIAKLLGTIPYEVLCTIGKRVARVYVGSAGS